MMPTDKIKENDLVSIIIPFHNNPTQLDRAVKSVLNQTFQNIEIIIIDDGSSEDYKDLVLDLMSLTKLKIKYIKQENTGPGLARQNGLNNATGKYIQYLDSDDELLPEKLEKQVKLLNDNLDVIMVWGLSQINSDSNVIHRRNNYKGNEDHVSISAIQKRKWHTSACLWNYETNKVYWEDLTNGEDVLHDVNAGLLNSKTKVLFKNSIVSNIYMDNGGDNLSNAIRDVNNHKRIVRDALELNNRIYEKVKKAKLINNKIVKESLAERFLYEGLKFYKLGFPKQGEKMLEGGSEISNNFFKQFEINFCKTLASLRLLSPYIIRCFFRIHRKTVSKDIHQFRSL